MGGDSMFCSKCGQEQVSESARFCSRCGFEFNSLEEGLAKRFVKMAVFLVLVICAIIGWGSIKSGPNYMQVRVIITLIAAMAFYLLFSRDLKHIFDRLFSHKVDQIKQITPANQEFVLPPVQSTAIPSLESHRVNTAEMVSPPSITEQTTILLDKNKL
jgi:uncharacterized protein (DUF983 family)